MKWFQVYDLFTKYGWKSGKTNYIWHIVLDEISYMAHVGGHNDNVLMVSFSTKDGVLPIVIYDLKTLETYLAPI